MMIENIGHFVGDNGWWLLAALLFVGAILYLSRDKLAMEALSFWRMDFWYRIWKLRQLAKNVSPCGDTQFPHWLTSEITLCGDYRQHICPMSEAEFVKRRVYLAKACDAGRSPTPLGFWVLLVLLVAAEAYGFAWLLAGGLGQDMSHNDRLIGTVAIVIVLCVIMVFLTHWAGQTLYHCLLVRKQVRAWREACAVGNVPRNTQLKTNAMVQILSTDQTLDDKDPPFSQALNRVKSGTRMLWLGPICVLLFCLLVGVLQVYLRVNDSARVALQDTAGVTQMAAMPTFSDTALPDDLQKPQDAADAQMEVQKHDLDNSYAWETAILLTVIYLATQAVGALSGYKYGFCGVESVDAYYKTFGFATYPDYLRRYKMREKIAVSRLRRLHQVMSDKTEVQLPSLVGSYPEYVKICELSEIWARREMETAQRTVPSAPRQAAAAAPEMPDATDAVASHFETLASMHTDAEKEAYLGTLDDDVYAAVLAYAKKRKAEMNDDAKKVVAERRRKEFEGLV